MRKEEKQPFPPLRYPGFPVEVGGVGEIHAAFSSASRTRGCWRLPRGRKSGYAPVGMTILWDHSQPRLTGFVAISLQQNCHPDRSVAQWRDLLFLFRFSQM